MKGGEGRADVAEDGLCCTSDTCVGLNNSWCLSAGMKKELQTLREEIKTLAGQIQRKLKGELSLMSCGRFAFWSLG